MSATPSASPDRVRLVDSAEGPGRTTATLLASLAARLAALHIVTGSDAIGSLTAGFAALGRQVSRTAKGASLRRAIEAGRPGMNGQALWTKLGIGDWASSMPLSPVLDQLRNDMALLLADDLDATLELMPIPARMAGSQGTPEPEPVLFVDCMLGLWAFASELALLVEALAAPTLDIAVTPGGPAHGANPGFEPESALLR